MFPLLQHIGAAVRYTQLPDLARRLTFYSEGRNYWRYLEPLISEILTLDPPPICFVTSDAGDPGLQVSHPKYNAFVIDEGAVRDWLFRHMETSVLVTTMPDLHRFQVKRSLHPVHYVFVQHSLVSLHRVYRAGAFDHYDTIFCAGPHHIEEMRAIEQVRNLNRKELVPHGYGPFDSLRLRAAAGDNRTGTPPHVLVAPSWGRFGLIESGVAETLAGQLLGRGYKVTLRPHPQTLRFSKDKVVDMMRRYADNLLFACEQDTAGDESLLCSDIMISDWSGVALEYMFALDKPVLYVDVPVKANNTEWPAVGRVPLEESIRGSERSELLPLSEVLRIHERIEALLTTPGSTPDTSRWIYNPCESGRHGARHLIKMLGKECIREKCA